ncbi:hypothetical protein HOY82DRAFT_560330 [Tuber indicum]|nr:hypothetical protein HOY82DRAFT_560330 [Tuber indicum]
MPNQTIANLITVPLPVLYSYYVLEIQVLEYDMNVTYLGRCLLLSFVYSTSFVWGSCRYNTVRGSDSSEQGRESAWLRI